MQTRRAFLRLTLTLAAASVSQFLLEACSQPAAPPAPTAASASVAPNVRTRSLVRRCMPRLPSRAERSFLASARSTNF
jgi:hypothetical protein